MRRGLPETLDTTDRLAVRPRGLGGEEGTGERGRRQGAGGEHVHRPQEAHGEWGMRLDREQIRDEIEIFRSQKGP